MKDFVDENYKFNKDYQKIRVELQKSLFQYRECNIVHTSQNSGKASVKIINDTNKQTYFIKKFRVLQFVQKIQNQIFEMQNQQAILENQKTKQNNNQSQRIQSLNFIQERIYQLIRVLNTVKLMRDDSKQIIYKYGYLIHRMIEQCKIFIMLTQSAQNDTLKQGLFPFPVANNMNFRPISIIILQLKDLMGYSYTDKDQLIKLKEQHVLNFDFSNKHIVPNQPLIDFLTQIPVKNNKIIINIIQLTSKYCSTLFDTKNNQNYTSISFRQAKRLIKRLYICRQQCDFLIYQFKSDDNLMQAQNIIMILRRITEQLGYLLEYNKNFQTARLVHQSIYFVTNVLSIFNFMIEKQPTNINLRIQCANYANLNYCQTYAIQILQKGFELTKNYKDLQVIRNAMASVKSKSKVQELSKTQTQQLYDNAFYQSFNLTILNAIRKIVDQEDV